MPRLIGALVCLTVLLAACEIEGGAERTINVPPTLVPAPTPGAGGAAAAADRTTWAIGLADEPGSLYPYPSNATSQRVAAPLTELLFPSPILGLGYGYTTTGVLERIPTLANGDAQIRKADVYLDATGSITTTATDVITQVDQLVVTFHWNPRLRWSDGKPVTADDSVFAYELAKQSPPGSDARDRLERIAAYEKVDDHTTRATLRPDIIEPAYFLNYWTPLPRHLLQKVAPDQVYKGDFATSPVGYGPYAIDQRAPREIRMVRNKYYFGAQPSAERLVITFMGGVDTLRGAILNDSLDVAVSDRIPAEQFAFLDQDAKSGVARVIYQPNPIWAHIDFNVDVPGLQDARVRRAIAFGTNRQAIVDALFKGRSPVLESWVLPGQEEAAPLDQITRYTYNPDQARQLLDEAGYAARDGGVRASPEGITLTFQLMTVEFTNTLLLDAARMFQKDMQAIGVQIDLKPMPPDQLFAAPDGPLFQRQFDLALFTWIAGSDPGGLLWSCNAVPSENNGWAGDNFTGWCSRDANRAIRMAVTTLDPAERKAAYLLQQKQWTEAVPSLPLFQRLSVAILAPGVQGPQPDPVAPITWNIASWKRVKK
jgi:peptide/nickel transport system substrate-binding protein